MSHGWVRASPASKRQVLPVPALSLRARASVVPAPACLSLAAQ
jgi:hypothetical protein